MKDLNRRKFEEDWRMAFDGAEVTPSASVWSNLEFDLVRSESDSMKKKVLFYKWLAAASVFLATFLGCTYYITSQSGDKEITSQEEVRSNSSLKNDDSLIKPDHDATGNQVTRAKDNTIASQKRVAKDESDGGNRET